MRDTEIATSIDRFDIKITVQTERMAPESVTNMVNSVKSVSGHIIDAFRSISKVKSPINITVDTSPNSSNTFTITPKKL